MRRVVFAVAAVACVTGLSLVPETGWASLYSPEDPFAIAVEGPKATPLPFEEFKRRLAVLTNALVEPKFGEKDNPDRQRFLDRIHKLEKTPKLPAADAAALAADLLRVGQSDKALNLLGPRTADRRPDYFVFTTLGHIHAMRGEWAEALRYHQEGLLDAKMPAEVKGLSKPTRDWWQKLDEEYVTHFYRVRKHEAEARRGLGQAELDRANETEDVLPLFPAPDGKDSLTPVKFVNNEGKYQPGTLADAEKAKLPPDAVAVAQQLVLWYPTEVRLYWLLAELYAALDDLGSAAVIFDECAWGRQYGNRKVLMDHRVAVHAAIDARPKPETPKPEEPPISMRTVMIYFGAIGLIGVLALVRTLLRRRPGEGCGPVG